MCFLKHWLYLRECTGVAVAETKVEHKRARIRTMAKGRKKHSKVSLAVEVRALLCSEMGVPVT